MSTLLKNGDLLRISEPQAGCAPRRLENNEEGFVQEWELCVFQIGSVAAGKIKAGAVKELDVVPPTLC